MKSVWESLMTLATIVIIGVILLRDQQQANNLIGGFAGTYTESVSKLASLG